MKLNVDWESKDTNQSFPKILNYIKIFVKFNENLDDQQNQTLLFSWIIKEI